MRTWCIKVRAQCAEISHIADPAWSTSVTSLQYITELIRRTPAAKPYFISQSRSIWHGGGGALLSGSECDVFDSQQRHTRDIHDIVPYCPVQHNFLCTALCLLEYWSSYRPATSALSSSATRPRFTLTAAEQKHPPKSLIKQSMIWTVRTYRKLDQNISKTKEVSSHGAEAS